MAHMVMHGGETLFPHANRVMLPEPRKIRSIEAVERELEEIAGRLEALLQDAHTTRLAWARLIERQEGFEQVLRALSEGFVCQHAMTQRIETTLEKLSVALAQRVEQSACVTREKPAARGGAWGWLRSWLYARRG